MKCPPTLIGKFKTLLKEYEGPEDGIEESIADLVKNPSGKHEIRVPANKEEGVSTGLRLVKGSKVRIFARGLISFDSAHHFTTPEGIMCTEYGFPYSEKNFDPPVPMVYPHGDAYQTDLDKVGLVGSLYGWIGERKPETSFFVGGKKEIENDKEGILYLAINDAKGTYGDNDGEFFVQIWIS